MKRSKIIMLIVAFILPVLLSETLYAYGCEFCGDFSDLCRDILSEVPCNPYEEISLEFRVSGEWNAMCYTDPWGGPNCDDWETENECTVTFICYNYCEVCIAVSIDWAWNCSTD